MEGESNSHAAPLPVAGSIVTEDDREAVNNLRMVLLFAAEAMNACAGRGISIGFNIAKTPEGRFVLRELNAVRQEAVVLPPVDLARGAAGNENAAAAEPEGAGRPN